MRRNLSFFKVTHNGQRWFATCCEYGPYTNPEEAMAKAEEYNRKAAKAERKRSRAVVMEWRKRKSGSLQ